MRWLLAVLLALSITACGEDPVQSGTVIAKQYDDPDHWVERVDDYAYSCQYEYGMRPDGTYGFGNICKDRHVGSHSEQRYDGPHWRLRVRDDKDSKRKQWVEVSQEEYGRFDRGGHWPDPR